MPSRDLIRTGSIDHRPAERVAAVVLVAVSLLASGASAIASSRAEPGEPGSMAFRQQTVPGEPIPLTPLTGLASLEATVTINVDGTVNGKATQGDLTAQLTSTDQSVSQIDVTGSLLGDVVAQVGGSAVKLFRPSGVSVYAVPEGTYVVLDALFDVCVKPNDSQATEALGQLSPQALMDILTGSDVARGTFVGDEILNDMPVKHYIIDGDEFITAAQASSDPNVSLFARSLLSATDADLYVAADGGYPVAYRGGFGGTFEPLKFEGDLSVQIDLTSVDGDTQVTLPGSCDHPSRNDAGGPARGDARRFAGTSGSLRLAVATSVEHREDRRSAGVAIRKRVPPSAVAGWAAAPDRPDPVDLILGQAATRIPELVPVRHGRMSASPFAYFRGAALPMAADIARLPLSGITVQVCGDAHLVNFGLFASPERDLVFDINDFDETLAGAWEWDVMRLSASLVLAARSRSFTGHQARHAVLEAVRTYRERMAEYASMRAIDVYYARVNSSAILEFANRRARPYLQSTIHAAAHHDALHELPKITSLTDGRRRIVDHPPIITHPDEMRPEPLAAALASYRESLEGDRRVLLDRYQLVDAALKVVGVGSVGLGAFVALLEGGSDDDPLFLQAKVAEASVFERFTSPSPFATHGERVVTGQRLLQAASDVLLGWAHGSLGRHTYIRQLQDQKESAVVEVMTHADLVDWGRLCGWALARGHARSGDPSMLAGYLGEDDAVEHAMADFAVRYADQTERDHAAFLAAIDQGRVEAETGV